MPILSHMRWVRKHFLTDPVVQSLQPKVRIRDGCLIVTSAQFADRLSLVFTHDSVQVSLHENGKLLEVYYNTAAKQVELTLAPSLGNLVNPFWTVGVPYASYIPIKDGTPPFTSLTQAGLPAGLPVT